MWIGGLQLGRRSLKSYAMKYQCNERNTEHFELLKCWKASKFCRHIFCTSTGLSSFGRVSSADRFNGAKRQQKERIEMNEVIGVDIFYFIVLAIGVIFAGGLATTCIAEGLRKRRRR